MRGCAYLSSRSVELVLSASERCLAPSVPTLLFQRLRLGVESRRQRVLTVGFGRVAAYLTLVSVLLTVSMSAPCFVPSAFRSLPARLRTRV